ncbi:MAG: DUF4440 domain-containing protein [Gemmatimonadota bacterium]|nr:MAG: DUF4440 domain-containing protein [Gemmatimonadota bacterium]
MHACRMLPALLVLVLLGTACGAPAEFSADDATAIRAVNEEMNRLALAGDWQAMSRHLTEDLVYMPPSLPVVEGRDPFLQWAASVPIELHEMAVEIADIDGRSDLAFLRGSYSQTYTIAGSPEPISDTGKFVWILRKGVDGAWRVSTWIWNPDAPFSGE